MIDKLQLYESTGVDPYENLAIEKYLLETVPDNCCTLYLWQNQNTVVIGRNQNPRVECKCSLLSKDNVHLARRLSGGGAVFHDLGNLNFTFLCSAENYDLQKQMQVIRTACLLAGIDAEVSGRNDILADGRKFSGNAFYNSQGKAYHHGTLLINADTEKMGRYLTPPKAKLEAKGVKSVKSRVVNLCELSPTLTCGIMRKNMKSAFEKVYGMSASLIGDIDREAVSLLAKEYSSEEYLYGKSLPFTFSCSERFSWGSVKMQLQAEKDIIKSVQVYTDAMVWELPEMIRQALTDCRFSLKEMCNALSMGLPQDFAEDFISMLRSQEL